MVRAALSRTVVAAVGVCLLAGCGGATSKPLAAGNGAVTIGTVTISATNAYPSEVEAVCGRYLAPTPPPNTTHAEAIAWVATLVRDLSSALRGLRPLVPGPDERAQARRMLAALATIRSVEAQVLRAGRTGTSFDLRAADARLRIANRQLRAAADALPAPMCATIGGAH